MGWVQKGSKILGETSSEQFGYSISINEKGNLIAIGAPGYSGTGVVQIYEFDDADDPEDWALYGSRIVCEGQGGYSVSLSLNGLVVAIGSPGIVIFQLLHLFFSLH